MALIGRFKFLYLTNKEGYMRKTPNEVSWGGALNDALSPSPSTSRVSTGSMTPSSHRLMSETETVEDKGNA